MLYDIPQLERVCFNRRQDFSLNGAHLQAVRWWVNAVFNFQIGTESEYHPHKIHVRPGGTPNPGTPEKKSWRSVNVNPQSGW